MNFLLHQLNDSNALRLIRILLATEGVVIDGDANAHQSLVDALDVLGMRVHAAGRVGHGLGGPPALIGPVAGVNQLQENKEMKTINQTKSQHVTSHRIHLYMSEDRS